MIKEFEISRSFSKTKQVQQFEPENYFCAAKMTFSQIPSTEEQTQYSAELEDFCRIEVFKTMEKSSNPEKCQSCGGLASNLSPVVDGFHQTCKTSEKFKGLNK